MDAVVDAADGRRAGPPRRPRDPEPRGRPGPLRRSGRHPRAHRDRPGRPGPRDPGRGLQPADPRGPDRRPARGDPRDGLEGRRRRDTGRGPPVRPVLRGARCRPVPRPEPGLQRPPSRDRIRPALARRLHALHADPGRGREHHQCRGRVRADGTGRGGGLRRGRARCRLHDPRGPRDRRPAGHRDQRRRGRPRRVLRGDRAGMSRWSPTVACAAAASWPRRSPRAPTP